MKRDGAGIETWLQLWRYSVANGRPPLPYSENWYEKQQQHSFPLRWLALSRIADTS